jgi:hypothetical protein
MILEEDLSGTHFVYEGFLVDFDASSIRQVTKKDYDRSPQKRGSNAQEKSSVADILCGDNTGPVMMVLWEEALQELNALSPPTETRQMIVRVENFQVKSLGASAWSGAVHTTIRTLQSISSFPGRPGTKITLVTQPTSPFLLSETFAVPGPSACISRFGSIPSLKAPCRMTLVGTVVNVHEFEYTQHGSRKREFDLVDESGSWMRCCGIGRNGENPNLQDGMDVVLYFTVARPPYGTSQGIVYLMRDSLMVAVRKRSAMMIPHKRSQIVIE